MFFLLLGCALSSDVPPDPCADACALLHDGGAFSCGTGDTDLCLDACTQSAAERDPSWDDWRSEWESCVSGYDASIPADGVKYGAPDPAVCQDAGQTCGDWPCERVEGTQDSIDCLGRGE